MNEEYGNDGSFGTALAINPTFPIYNEDGSYYQPTAPTNATNPVEKMLNKTAEKIEMTIYAYNPKLEKNSTKPIGWFKFGTTKVKDYNDLDTMSKAIKYKVTSIKEFRYFAYSTSKTVREVKFNLDYEKEAFTVRADYVNKVRPLASVEVKPVLATKRTFSA